MGTRSRAVGPMGLLASVVAAIAAVGHATADPLCAYRTESGAIVYTNTPGKDGVCAAAAQAPLLGPAPSASVARYDRLIREAALNYGVSPRLVHAVIATESAYNPNAVSSKGAQGLMQLMPATARLYGVTDLFNPQENIRAGVAHLSGLLDQFGGDTRLAVAAYNAGAVAVQRYAGVPPFLETRLYVSRVLAKLGGQAHGLVRRPGEFRKGSSIEVRVGPGGIVSWVN